MSLFHYAARAGHWNLMEGFVRDYCQHEVPYDETFLIACRHGQGLIVSNLMRGFAFDISDGRAVNVAAAAGHADVLTYLMDLSQKTAEDGRNSSSYNIIANASSLLNLAVTNGHEKVVDVILDRIPDSDSFRINEKDERTDRTPLFSAVMCNNENMVRNLLARGAEIKAHGNTAVHIAAEHGYQGIMRILLTIATNHFDDIDIDDGVQKPYPVILLQSRDTGGDYPIHKAARNGHSGVVELILEYHPQAVFLRMSLKGKPTYPELGLGYTALHLAARGGHLDVLRILIDSGADIEARTDRSDLGAFHLAAAEGHEAVVRLLLQHSASAYIDKVKALHLAVDRGHDGIVRAFVEDISTNGQWMYTNSTAWARLIEIAAKNGFDAVLHTLLEGPFDSDGKRLAKQVLQVAKREKYKNAITVLTNILEERGGIEILK